MVIATRTSAARVLFLICRSPGHRRTVEWMVVIFGMEPDRIGELAHDVVVHDREDHVEGRPRTLFLLTQIGETNTRKLCGGLEFHRALEHAHTHCPGAMTIADHAAANTAGPPAPVEEVCFSSATTGCRGPANMAWF